MQQEVGCDASEEADVGMARSRFDDLLLEDFRPSTTQGPSKFCSRVASRMLGRWTVDSVPTQFPIRNRIIMLPRKLSVALVTALFMASSFDI